jgi:outer membrane receptor protein involved in Fe transport
VRLGIDNLFDEDPMITGAMTDFGGGLPSTGRGTTHAGFYDTLGRRAFLGFNASF